MNACSLCFSAYCCDIKVLWCWIDPTYELRLFRILMDEWVIFSSKLKIYMISFILMVYIILIRLSSCVWVSFFLLKSVVSEAVLSAYLRQDTIVNLMRLSLSLMSWGYIVSLNLSDACAPNLFWNTEFDKSCSADTFVFVIFMLLLCSYTAL